MTGLEATVWYRSGPQGRFVFEELDELYLVFDRHFGTTHFLDFFAAAILRQLAAEPKDPRGLRACVAADIDLLPDDIPVPRLDAALNDLTAAGLIAKAPNA